MHQKNADTGGRVATGYLGGSGGPGGPGGPGGAGGAEEAGGKGGALGLLSFTILETFVILIWNLRNSSPHIPRSRD
jgi:hypothetical protein